MLSYEILSKIMAKRKTNHDSVLLNDELLGFNQQQNLWLLARNSIQKNPKTILLAGGIVIVLATAAIIFWPVIAAAVVYLTALKLAAMIVTGLVAIILAFNGLMISKEIIADPTSSKFNSSFCRFQSLFSSSTGNHLQPVATVNTNPPPPPHQPVTNLPAPQQPTPGLPAPRPGNNPGE
jgi:hypothetical protein